MVIGGEDTVLAVDVQMLVLRQVDLIISDRWPGFQWETDSDREFFYYENACAKLDWDDHGRTEENADKMVHILFHLPEITVVTDGPRTRAICNEIRHCLGKGSK